MNDILLVVYSIQNIKENPWLLAYFVVALVIWIAKHPKILYPLLSRFPRLAGFPVLLAALGIDVNGVLKGLSLIIRGRMRVDDASQATIYYLDKLSEKEGGK